MGQSPQELRHDIERTREGMDATLDRIEDRVSPGRIVERRKERARTMITDVRDRVMGTADDLREQGHDKMDEAGSRLDDLQEEGKRQYQGNPLAAGLIAFGAGALVGSLLPKTEQEHKVAEQLQERVQPAVDELKEAGEHVVDDLKVEAAERMEETKQTASQAAQVVKDDARSSAQDLKEESRDRAQHVQDEARR